MVLDIGVSPPLLLDVLLFFSSGELMVLPGLVEDPMEAAAAAAEAALAAIARLLAAILACSSWCCWWAPIRANADGLALTAAAAAMLVWLCNELTVCLSWPWEAMPMLAAVLTALRYEGGKVDGSRVMLQSSNHVVVSLV